MKFLRYFYSYVPTDNFPEVPEEEPSDPNEGRDLSASYRSSRRNLVVLSAVGLAWATAQFSVSNFQIKMLGTSLNLSNISVPVLLGVALLYLIVRWTMEFSMMERHIRRWPLAQLDFRIVFNISRFSLLAVTAGSMSRSLITVLGLIATLGALAVASVVLSILLMFVTMPIRMWARRRANVDSAANAASEALFWAGLFAVCLTVLSVISFGICIYHYPSLSGVFWSEPPSPVSLSVFIFTLVTVFLSHWLMNPVLTRIFAIRPGYRTKLDDDGNRVITFVDEQKEPLI